MELLSLSKFKLQLFALIFEARDLKEKEQRAREELHLLIQKQKQNEVELGRKFQEMQAELALCHEMQHNLENKVKYLENDNALQEKKQKELKGTIDSLLQSRETFVSRYEDSTCELKHSIETRDRKLAVLSEKLQTHFLLFDSIEKEAVAVKQVVDSVQCLVNEKEKVVAGLKKKMDKISTFEKDFFEKISFLENMLRNNQDELRRKDGIVWELKEQLKEAKVSCNLEPQIDELQKSLSMKEEIIQNLTAENQKSEKKSVVVKHVQGIAEKKIIALPLYQEHSLVSKPSWQKQNVEAYVSERFICSPSQSTCSNPMSTANVMKISTDGKKGTSCTSCVQQLDSESSTTEAERSDAQV
ncbi:uncharacterized protein LOC143858603 isoform X2 [Tasmannia lanceolata]|uniref:uncharacterized protein LOC143858603 isoform X2 n=1 Tax=Tasmannia lanceolata TaxID=3420 RepID=UPI0040641C69